MSIVAPIYFSATLVTNLILFGFILGLEYFDRIRIIGTYVIVIGAILLTTVGPGIQHDQNNFVDLLYHTPAFIWFLLLLLAMIVSTLLMLRTVYEEKKQIIVLLIVRSSSYALNLTVSRGLLLNCTPFILLACIVIKVVSGAIYTYAIVVQSTTVTQSKFVPLNATSIILTNAITGICIWQDWKVISSWVGYICVFLLLALGCDLLLSSNLLTNENPDYGSKKRATIIIESTPFKLVRSFGRRNLYENIPPNVNEQSVDSTRVSGVHNNHLTRVVSDISIEENRREKRREAWKSLLAQDRRI